VAIPFIVDEHLPYIEVRHILVDHAVDGMDLGTKDPAILAAAEIDGAVILTADKWFSTQLRRMPHFDKHRHLRAGVVWLPGTWAVAGPMLRRWLPVVEAVYQVTRLEQDQRVVVALRANGVVYIDPSRTTEGLIRNPVG